MATEFENYNAADSTRPMAGQPHMVVAEYALIQQLPHGGMGEVWRCRHRVHNAPVAIKFIYPGAGSGDSLGKLAGEFELLQGIRPHPNVVRVMEHGVHTTPTGTTLQYFVMDLVVDALPITAYAEKHSLNPKDRLKLFLDASSAVEHVHGHGILHLDIKPSNVLVDDEGKVVVVDFGVARTLWRWLDGAVGGTPGYMSLEHWNAKPEQIDKRADVWSLAALLHELLTGQLPYDLRDEASRRTAEEILAEPPPSLRECAPSLNAHFPGVLSRLDAVVRQGLSPERVDRPETVADFRRAIEQAVEVAPPHELSIEAVRAFWIWGQSKWLARPRFAAFLLVLIVSVVSCVLGGYLSMPLFRAWPKPLEWYGAWLPEQPHSVVAPDALQNVALIGFDSDSAQALAGAEGLEDFAPGNRSTYRTLHAAAIGRLVEARVRVIVLDIAFVTETRNDELLAGAIRSARDADVPVVVAGKLWQVDDDGRPPISPTIWNAGPSWGGWSYRGWEGVGNCIPLVVQRDKSTFMPSLATAAYACFRHPDLQHEFSWDGDDVIIRFFRSSPGRHDIRIYDSDIARIRPTHPAPFDARNSFEHGLKPGDFMADYAVPLAPLETVNAATLRYEDLWATSPFDLRNRLSDRVVVVYDLEFDPPVPTDHRYQGGQLHASAIQLLISLFTLRAARLENDALWLLCGIGGALIGMFAVPRHRVSRAAAGDQPQSDHSPPRGRAAAIRAAVVIVTGVVAIALAVLGYAWFAYRFRDTLLFPLPGMLVAACAAVLACVLFTRIRRPGYSQGRRSA